MALLAEVPNVYDQHKVWYTNDYNRNYGKIVNSKNCATGVVVSIDNDSFFHTKPSRRLISKTIFNSNIKSKIIKYIKEFEKQFSEKNEFFSGVEKVDIQNNLKKSLLYLISINPDKMSLELTYEGDLFYTIIKDNIKLYITHFSDIDEEDEIAVAVFENEQKKPSFAGDFQFFKDELNELLINI